MTQVQTNQITTSEFKEFLKGTTVQYDGDSYESNGYLKDSEGENIASINYDTDKTEVSEEIYLNESDWFLPTPGQKTIMLDLIDRECRSEREAVSELRNESSDPNEMFGVSPSDFFS